jgi:tripartite-type tricarboxylate transporter receptor subunit TctC
MRKLLAAALASAFVVFTGSASAQEDYPNRPITILVPAAAGGPSDTVARLVADAMRVDLGQQVLVENVGGAGGSLGAGRVASAAPPKDTPEAIKNKLSASLQKALADPKLIERFGALGTVPVAAELATPAALDERFRSEVERWGKLLSAK